MKRDCYVQLKAWKDSPYRKPLLLQGARQVGKTHLLAHFGAHEYANVVVLDFEADPIMASFFEKSLQPHPIIEQLAIHFGTDIQPQKTLLIFDEIQACPNALNSLKYFCEQASEFHVAAAGSLLGVKLGNMKSFPVGKVNFLTLYPLSFFEFLDAMNRERLRTMLETLDQIQPITQAIHEDLISLLKQYFYLGGMPEVISRYLKTHQYDAARRVQAEILNSYLLDFSKHADPHQTIKIRLVWESLSAQLAKENKRFLYSVVRESARAREYEAAIQWLVDAGLVYKSSLIKKPGCPLLHYADPQTFKLFVLDIGLLGAMTRLPVKALLQGGEIFSEFKGALTENYVAQALTQTHHQPLYYWASSGTAEVDFVFEQEMQCYPLEVKAGLATKSKSLNVYSQKYAPPALLRTSMRNLKTDGQISNYPLYLIQKLPLLVNKG